MKIITGDYVGLIKALTFNEAEATAIPSKKLKSAGKKSAETPQTPVYTIHGKVDKKGEINCLCWFGNDKSKIVAARANGLIELIELNNQSVNQDANLNLNQDAVADAKVDPVMLGTVKESYSAFDSKSNVDRNGNRKLNKHQKPIHFIGVFSFDGVIISCTDTGLINYRHTENSTSSLPNIQADLEQHDLCAMNVHPNHPHIFATGGDERELCLWDITKFNPETKKISPIWKAKNVSDTSLGLRVPVWITCIQWASLENYHEIVIGTGYRHVRKYDTKNQKKPLVSFEVGAHPVKALALSPTENEYITSDTLGNIFAIDMQNGQLKGKYKGIAGAVMDIKVCTSASCLVTVSMDRKLRIFELKQQRRIMKDVYLKQHLSKVLIDETAEEEIKERIDADEGNLDAVWEEMSNADSEKSEEESEKSESETENSQKKRRRL